VLSLTSPRPTPYWKHSGRGYASLASSRARTSSLSTATEGNYERLPALAADLVRLPVEVIVAGGAPAIRAAQYATRTIPIVMGGTFDPVAEGFVASLTPIGGLKIAASSEAYQVLQSEPLLHLEIERNQRKETFRYEIR
jgi:hypothetical protein